MRTLPMLCWFFGVGSLVASVSAFGDELLEKAHSGDRDSEFLLAQRISQGRDESYPDKGAAWHWYELAAQQGHPVAQAVLGGAHSLGLGGYAKDCRKASEWYRKAAESGDYSSWRNLAWKVASCEDSSFRDGARALRLVSKYAAYMPEDASTLELLAAANAAVGDFRKAVVFMEAAIELAALRDKHAASRYEARLQKYLKNELYEGPFTVEEKELWWALSTES